MAENGGVAVARQLNEAGLTKGDVERYLRAGLLFD